MIKLLRKATLLLIIITTADLKIPFIKMVVMGEGHLINLVAHPALQTATVRDSEILKVRLKIKTEIKCQALHRRLWWPRHSESELRRGMNTVVDAVCFPSRRFYRIRASSCKLKLLIAKAM
jgi:hypothetical protein